jgi:hypothetical protein
MSPIRASSRAKSADEENADQLLDQVARSLCNS